MLYINQYCSTNTHLFRIYSHRLVTKSEVLHSIKGIEMAHAEVADQDGGVDRRVHRAVAEVARVREVFYLTTRLLVARQELARAGVHYHRNEATESVVVLRVVQTGHVVEDVALGQANVHQLLLRGHCTPVAPIVYEVEEVCGLIVSVTIFT